MLPVTVTVGPLQSASANNICTSQTIPTGGGTFALNGSLASSTFVGTGAIAGNTLTVSGVTSGILNRGNLLNGLGVQANTFVIGTLASTTNGVGTYVVNTAQTLSSTTIYAGTTVTLDTPRRVIFTSAGNDSGVTFTLIGTDWAGAYISEQVTGANVGVATSVLDYATITSITASAATASTITVGTNGVAGSAWVRTDDFALGSLGAQFSVTGTVNYTLRTAFVEGTGTYSRANTVWDTSASPVINATGTTTITLTSIPRQLQVLLNSGSGSVTATFTQYGVAPY